jgi:hypothetical protein
MEAVREKWTDERLDEFDAMHKLMIQLFAGMIGTFLTATAVLVATQL